MEQYVLLVEQCRELVQLGLDMNNAKNQYFNKRISKLKSELTNNKKTSRQIRNLYGKRDNK